MSKTWFTADLHLGHSRIIQYCTRPFKDYEEMEEVMVERFNSKLQRGDSLYIIGDLCWSTYNLGKGSFLDKLNCNQFFLVKGNHDRKNDSEYRKHFAWIGDYKTLALDDNRFILSHYPFRTWVSKQHGAYHLYGHVHGRMPGEGRSMDVGVDPLNFYPISSDEVVERLKDVVFRKDEP